MWHAGISLFNLTSLQQPVKGFINVFPRDILSQLRDNVLHASLAIYERNHFQRMLTLPEKTVVLRKDKNALSGHDFYVKFWFKGGSPNLRAGCPLSDGRHTTQNRRALGTPKVASKHSGIRDESGGLNSTTQMFEFPIGAGLGS